jgi:RNA-binding protein with serine-rich domain 1
MDQDRGRSPNARQSRPLGEARSVTRSQSQGRRDRARSRTRSRSPSRGRTRSRSRSRSVHRYHSRSESRSPTPNPSPPRSSKASIGLFPACKMTTWLLARSSIDTKLILIFTMKIVVEKLTKNVTENHVREIFGGFGEIEYLDVPINKACKTCFRPVYLPH